MRVLVTGAGGSLGRAVVPALVDEGHEPVLLDLEELDGEHEAVRGDVRDRAALERAVRGVDAVVHAAALHGVHLHDWSADDFWSINVTGTYLVYEAARAAGVRTVVLGSSMVVYGDLGAAPDPWSTVTEDSPLRPANLYGLTKVLSEDVARYHATAGAVDTVALRLGMFVPETFVRYGFRLLFGGVDDRDVAQAVLRALDHRPEDGFAAFDVMADSRLAAADRSRLSTAPLEVLEEHYPGTAEVVEEHSLDLDELVWGRTTFPVDRARSQLGWSPRYDFGAFLTAYRDGDTDHYPYADRPWWGTQRPGR